MNSGICIVLFCFTLSFASATDQMVNATFFGRRLRGKQGGGRNWKGTGAVEGLGDAAPRELRITRGLGRFAGADFPCQERDAHIGASWSKGACLMLCENPPSSSAPLCEHAKDVCRNHAADGCRTVDINVEGTVATLKKETELSQRTSWVKDIKVTRAHGDRAIGIDRPCQEANARLPRVPKGSACTLRCPLLDCSRAIELCYNSDSCVGVDLAFNTGGYAAVARLRYT